MTNDAIKVMKLKLTRFKNKVDAASTEEEIHKVKIALPTIQPLLNEFYNNSDDEAELDTFENMYCEVLLKAHELIKSIETTQSLPSTTNSTLNNTDLPKIELPTFDGNLRKWLDFKFIFQSLIETFGISNVRKQLYLHSCLIGEPRQLIDHILCDDEGYVKCWQTLELWYGRKNRISKLYVKDLFDLPIETKDQSSLNSLLYELKISLARLQDLNRPVLGLGHDLLIHIVLKNVRNKTHREWCQHSVKLDQPTIDDLIAFLEKRCELASLLAESSSNMNIFDKSKVKSRNHKEKRCKLNANSKTKASCFNCKQDHEIFRCKTFKQMQPRDRVSLIKNLQLCSNCLRHGHFAKGCRVKSRCKVCNKNHNTLLHLKDNHSVQSRKRVCYVSKHVQSNIKKTKPTESTTCSNQVQHMKNVTNDEVTLSENAHESTMIQNPIDSQQPHKEKTHEEVSTREKKSTFQPSESTLSSSHEAEYTINDMLAILAKFLYNCASATNKHGLVKIPNTQRYSENKYVKSKQFSGPKKRTTFSDICESEIFTN